MYVDKKRSYCRLAKNGKKGTVARTTSECKGLSKTSCGETKGCGVVNAASGSYCRRSARKATSRSRSPARKRPSEPTSRRVRAARKTGWGGEAGRQALRRLKFSTKTSPATKAAASRRGVPDAPFDTSHFVDDEYVFGQDDDRPLAPLPTPTSASMDAILRAVHPGMRMSTDAKLLFVAMVRGVAEHHDALVALDLHVASFLRSPPRSHVENPTVRFKSKTDATVVASVDWLLYDVMEMAGNRAEKLDRDVLQQDDVLFAVRNDGDMAGLFSWISDRFA